MNLAIFSPNQNPFSETFIQAHKHNIKAKNLYYIYGRSIEDMIIENEGPLISPKKRLIIKGTSKLLDNKTKPNFNNEAAKRLKVLKIDVALIEYGNHAMKLIEIFKISKIPFIVHFHGYDISVEKIIIENKNYKSLFETASYLIGVSKLMCDTLKNLGCPKEKVVYNVYGASSVYEDIKPHYDNKNFLSVGRFVDKKAPYYTILAFSKAIKIHPDAVLTMVGDGILLNTCKNLIKFFKIENNIKLVGAVPPENIKNLMQSSYGFIQHSVTAENGNQEGTPVAIMEAALAGLPVISTNHAGIPDVIEHEKTGLLSDEHDVEAMAQNILRVIEDKKLAIQLGMNAKKIHKEKFPLSKHIKTIEDILKKTINLV